jgi:hypothetical protein
VPGSCRRALRRGVRMIRVSCGGQGQDRVDIHSSWTREVRKKYTSHTCTVGSLCKMQGSYFETIEKFTVQVLLCKNPNSTCSFSNSTCIWPNSTCIWPNSTCISFNLGKILCFLLKTRASCKKRAYGSQQPFHVRQPAYVQKRIHDLIPYQEAYHSLTA